MKTILLAFSLIRIPRLFVSLLLWPMIIGVGVAVVQAITSSAYMGLVEETSDQFENRIQTESPETAWLRSQLFGSKAVLPALQVCRWKTDGLKEVSPSVSCEIKENDVAIVVKNPITFDSASYESYFQGSTRTLHICKTCSSNIVIDTREGKVRSDIFGFTGLAVMALTDTTTNAKTNTHFVEAKKTIEGVKEISGTLFLHPAGSKEPINVTQTTKTMLLILNTSLMTLIALWLSLKGHKKVLDYFSKNGALLPLVAACGKDSFYAALWIITLLRVFFFIVAAIPSTVFLYSKAVPQETLDVFIRSTPDFIMWLSALIASLSCLAIIASVAELKQRHSWVSFLYKYVPVSLCFLGTVVWIISVFTPGEASRVIQVFISCIPIIGISPILLSPIFNINSTVVMIHSLLASATIILLLRHNSRWFAAHLEEI